ncbi:right-handed parallel beta-helix repeat-containing protein [Paenibacillus lutrae]|uniref:right-handed parallel beta-helix repeat-containing protein n=1 Tax=Paenibacillus lutrae TaxID=2078573 RepID=UPI0012F98490
MTSDVVDYGVEIERLNRESIQNRAEIDSLKQSFIQTNIEFGSRSFNVEWFGGKGDGEKISTEAVQQIIDFLGEKGGTVFFPYGIYLLGSITCRNDIRFECAPGTVIKFINNTNGFKVDNCSNITFSDFIFDGSLQTTGTRYMIKGSNASKVMIKRLRLSNGSYGIWLENITDGVILDCEGYGFRDWPFYIQGCNGFKYLRNKSFNNQYDGLKMGGLDLPNPKITIKNTEVAGNECYGNVRDGFDIAANNIENLIIHDNNFHDNLLQGIDCKVVYQSDYMRNIHIYANSCSVNHNQQINVQCDIVASAAERIVVGSNTLYCASSNDPNSAGIRMYGMADNCRVHDNHISDAYNGVRISDSSNVTVENNIIRSGKFGIREDLVYLTQAANNVYQGNNVVVSDNCFYKNDPRILNTIVRSNRFTVTGTGYRVYVIGAESTSNCYNNDGGYSNSMPSGRATKGDVFFNTDVTNENCLGWIAMSTSPTAEYDIFGKIGTAKTKTAQIDFPAISPGATSAITYSSLACNPGDMVTAVPLAAVPAGLVWNVWIISANRIELRLTNTTGNSIDPAPVNWRFDVLK